MVRAFGLYVRGTRPKEAEFEIVRDKPRSSSRLDPVGGAMKLKIDKEWLDRKLAKADDANASAGGTSFEEMKKNVDRRVVTPSSIAGARSELGKVVRFVREKKGISRH